MGVEVHAVGAEVSSVGAEGSPVGSEVIAVGVEGSIVGVKLVRKWGSYLGREETVCGLFARGGNLN